MTLKDYKDAYYDLSGLASTVSRQSAYAGIALIWIFKSEDVKTGAISLPDNLFMPVLFLVLCLAFDLMQYIAGAAIWGGYHRHLEKEGRTEEDCEVEAKPWLNWPALFFFWGKLVFVLIAYFNIFMYVNSFVKFS